MKYIIKIDNNLYYCGVDFVDEGLKYATVIAKPYAKKYRRERAERVLERLKQSCVNAKAAVLEEVVK